MNIASIAKWIVGLAIGGFIILSLSSNTSGDSPKFSNSVPSYSRFNDDTVDYTNEYETVTSDNWVCTEDCSGHEAGFNWAEENGITDPSDCGGKSDSFIEGCEAYANEQTMEEDDYGYEDYDPLY